MKIVFRVVAIAAAALGVLAIAAAGVAVSGNSYDFDERDVKIPTEDGHLAGVLTTPKNAEARGLVVMIHGDGPVDATQGGLYDPWFDGAAASDYATLSWSKPGIGGSDGDWLSQSMADRAKEVETAIDWARTQPEIPTSRLVLWGASRAGWVLPTVVAARNDIDGVVAVGTAVNWLRQGRFNLEAQLDHDEASPEARARAEAESQRVDALLAAGASYEEYASTTTDPMTRERWGFVSKNYTVDATSELTGAATRGVPWLLFAGEHDRNVDMAETARTYRDILGSAVIVTKVDAVHSMARPVVDDSELIGVATGILWPRALLAAGVIDAYRSFLDDRS